MPPSDARCPSGATSASSTGSSLFRCHRRTPRAGTDQRWLGPLESRFGHHLVRIEARQPATVPPLRRIEVTCRPTYSSDGDKKRSKPPRTARTQPSPRPCRRGLGVTDWYEPPADGWPVKVARWMTVIVPRADGPGAGRPKPHRRASAAKRNPMRVEVSARRLLPPWSWSTAV